LRLLAKTRPVHTTSQRKQAGQQKTTPHRGQYWERGAEARFIGSKHQVLTRSI
jgi:hypothetical protein